ncbi:MAG TPA: hypothetical protein VJ417_15495 [Candidatus Glassbacteria bacterium]|nr:hypothetical protein [Candidatus Glassbacteria bacterium]
MSPADKSRRLRGVAMVALAVLIASAILGLVFPETFAILRVPERLAALGLFLLLIWLWLAKGYAKGWISWLGLLGLTLLLGPGMFWAIWAESPETNAPPRWLNWLTLCGYPLVLAWACQRLCAMLVAVRRARATGFLKE